METSPWGDLTVLQYLGQGLADRKDQRVRENNRLERGGVALDPELAAELKAVARYSEERYNDMLMAEYERRIPENLRKWAAGVPGLATGELFPRIIAALGHPRIATPRRPNPDDPQRRLIADPAYIRGPHELRQYAGAGDPTRKPRKGMSQEDLFAMGKTRQVRPLLFTWSTGLVKNATPARAGKHPGEPKSPYAASSVWWRIFTTARRKYAGHDGKCPDGEWPLPCAGSHTKHSWLVTTTRRTTPLSVIATTPARVRAAAEWAGFPVTVTSQNWPEGLSNWAESAKDLDAIIRHLPVILCKNRKIPPAKPNGCGIGVHPEWGEAGSPWRPGHINMAAHRRLHQKFLNGLWEAAGWDGLTPYEFKWEQGFQGFGDEFSEN